MEMEDIQEKMSLKSVEVCRPIVRAVMRDRHILDNDQTLEFIRAMENEKLLRFGEIILLTLISVKLRNTENYFRAMYYAAIKMDLLYDAYIWDISEDELEVLIAEHSQYTKVICRRFYRRAKESKYNIKKEKESYRNSRYFENRYSYKDFFAKLEFPQDYQCSPNIRFETLFKYWVFVNKDWYSQDTLNDICTSYCRLEELAGRPFKLIRYSDVLKCINECSLDQKNKVIFLYRTLDKFAYEKDLIPKQYAKSLNYFEVTRQQKSGLTDAEVQELQCHRGEISVDITLVLIYTGITLLELYSIEKEDVDENYIYIRKGRTIRSRRNILIHPSVQESLKHVLEYLENRKQEVEKISLIGSIGKLVGDATVRYCERRYMARECRYTFTNKLFSMGVPSSIVEDLIGARSMFLWSYERSYIHQSRDRLSEAIMLINWEG